MVEERFPLFSSLRRETLPSSSSIHQQLSLVGFCSSRSSQLASLCKRADARRSICFSARGIYIRVGTIPVFYTCKRTTVGLTDVHVAKCFPVAHKRVGSLLLANNVTEHAGVEGGVTPSRLPQEGLATR